MNTVSYSLSLFLCLVIKHKFSGVPASGTIMLKKVQTLQADGAVPSV